LRVLKYEFVRPSPTIDKAHHDSADGGWSSATGHRLALAPVVGSFECGGESSVTPSLLGSGDEIGICLVKGHQFLARRFAPISVRLFNQKQPFRRVV